MNDSGRKLPIHRAGAVLLISLLAAVGVTACDPGVNAGAVARADAAIKTYAPAKLRGNVPYRLSEISGITSYTHQNGLIQVSTGQFKGSWDHARHVALHEYGHLVAYKYGAGNGAPPSNFPHNGSYRQEVWAECFSEAMTGVHRKVWKNQYAECTPKQAKWVGNWVRFWHT